MGLTYANKYSPLYNPSLRREDTGRKHEWVYRDDNDYYDNAYRCRLCGKENWGWNLWKEDLEPNCKGKE